MTALAHAQTVVDLGHLPADDGPPGARLAARLNASCADLSRKAHLASTHDLGHTPSADEAAIFTAAVDALDAAARALSSWQPSTWDEFALKSDAFAQAAATGRIAHDYGQAELVCDLKRLAADLEGIPESAIPVLAREMERRRESPGGELDDTPREDLFFLSDKYLLAAPCTTLPNAAAKLRAALDPDIGVEATGLGEWTPSCLRQVLQVLESEIAAQTVASSLQPLTVETLRLEAEAEPMGYAEEDDGGDWLGMPLIYRRDAVADRIHLAPCASRADALQKLDMALRDLTDVTDLEALTPVLTFNLETLRAWLDGQSAPAPSEIVTRAEHRGLPHYDREVASL